VTVEAFYAYLLVPSTLHDAGDSQGVVAVTLSTICATNRRKIADMPPAVLSLPDDATGSKLGQAGCIFDGPSQPSRSGGK
jgi:hypothetical protein